MPMIRSKSEMLRVNTPVEDYRKEYGLWVKREDLACFPPGPAFSKTRGVYAHVRSRPEKLIGVLDTFHSQAGHAVARACQILGKKCINFYPVYKREREDADDGSRHELRQPQIASQDLGAELHGLPAGRSCILYHAAKKETLSRGGYMMPNALKLDESVTETAKEVPQDLNPDFVIIPASSGTIAAGVVKGFTSQIEDDDRPQFIIHLGYSRSALEVRKYLREKSGLELDDELIEVIDEGYAYKDEAEPGETPPWPCNSYYDLKAFRWWLGHRERYPDSSSVLFWNIG